MLSFYFTARGSFTMSIKYRPTLFSFQLHWESYTIRDTGVELLWWDREQEQEPTCWRDQQSDRLFASGTVTTTLIVTVRCTTAIPASVLLCPQKRVRDKCRNFKKSGDDLCSAGPNTLRFGFNLQMIFRNLAESKRNKLNRNGCRKIKDLVIENVFYIKWTNQSQVM